MMTPLRPTVSSSVLTRFKPEKIWGVYSSLEWEQWNPNVVKVEGLNSEPTGRLKIGMKLDITTSSPSYTGPTFLESCFHSQMITYTLPLSPLCTTTHSYTIIEKKNGETEVTHGVRYDGLMKGWYEGSVGEGELRESVESLLRIVEAEEGEGGGGKE